MQGPPLNTSAPIGRASDPRSHVIEAAEEPHEESWANINAMNGLVHEVLDTDSHVVVSAMAGNAGAGGVPLALAADEVCARPGVVLNPHHKARSCSARSTGPTCSRAELPSRGPRS